MSANSLIDIIAYAFGPDGSVRELEPEGRRADELDDEAPEGGFVWIHANMSQMAARNWLAQAGLEPRVFAAITEIESRPRCIVLDDAALMNLRGVNLNPGAEADDMVSLRFYISRGLVISAQRRRIFAVADVVEGLSRGPGPVSAGELVARLALRLSDRAEPVVTELNEMLDDLEDAVPDGSSGGSIGNLRGDLGDLRSTAITLRRFMFPQRDALSTLEIEEFPWLSDADRGRLHDAVDRVLRLTEELDAIRDRAQVVQDLLSDLRSEQMNRQMLFLAIVSAVFMPLSFVTGLLGANVGGIPGQGPVGFWAVCAMLALLAGLLIWLFRKTGLIGR